MGTRKPSGNLRKKTKPRAFRKPVIPTDEQLEARRARVLELWGKSDRRIARVLIDEGFFVPPQSRVAVDQTKFEDSCRRNVSNDRAAIREQWRAKKPSRTVPDVVETTEDYIARLQMRVDEIDDLLADRTLKPTPRMLAISEVRQLEALIAKARGVDAAPDRSPEDETGGADGAPFLGVVVSLDKVSPAAQKKINEWISRK